MSLPSIFFMTYTPLLTEPGLLGSLFGLISTSHFLARGAGGERGAAESRDHTEYPLSSCERAPCAREGRQSKQASTQPSCEHAERCERAGEHCGARGATGVRRRAYPSKKSRKLSCGTRAASVQNASTLRASTHTAPCDHPCPASRPCVCTRAAPRPRRTLVHCKAARVCRSPRTRPALPGSTRQQRIVCTGDHPSSPAFPLLHARTPAFRPLSQTHPQHLLESTREFV